MRAQIDAMLAAQDAFVKQCSEDRQSLGQDIHSAVTDLASRRAQFTQSSQASTSECVSKAMELAQDRHEKLKDSTQESIRTESESQNTMFESLESELTTRLDLIKTSAENFETRREKIEEEMSEFAAKSSASAKESRVQVLEEIKSNMSDVESTLESSKKELKDMTETCVQNTNERMTNAVEKFDRNTVDKIVSSHRAHADSVLDKEVGERAASQFKSREEFLENSLKDTVSFCESVHKSVASDVVSPVRGHHGNPVSHHSLEHHHRYLRPTISCTNPWNTSLLRVTRSKCQSPTKCRVWRRRRHHFKTRLEP
jgi:hypothetical protein